MRELTSVHSWEVAGIERAADSFTRAHSGYETLTSDRNIYCANERMQREIVLSFLLHAWTEGSSLISHQLHQEYEQTVNNNPDSGLTEGGGRN